MSLKSFRETISNSDFLQPQYEWVIISIAFTEHVITHP